MKMMNCQIKILETTNEIQSDKKLRGNFFASRIPLLFPFIVCYKHATNDSCLIKPIVFELHAY